MQIKKVMSVIAFKILEDRIQVAGDDGAAVFHIHRHAEALPARGGAAIQRRFARLRADDGDA